MGYLPYQVVSRISEPSTVSSINFGRLQFANHRTWADEIRLTFSSPSPQSRSGAKKQDAIIQFNLNRTDTNVKSYPELILNPSN